MKRKVLVLASLVTIMGASQLKAQLNVGSTAAPDASAALQISSTTQGLRMPNVALTTTTTFAPVVTPTSAPAAIGLSVYNTTAGITSSNALYPATGVGVYTWNGTGWVTASGVAGAVAGTNYWTLTGSNLYNNSGTNVGIGTTTPLQLLHVRGAAPQAIITSSAVPPLNGFIGLVGMGATNGGASDYQSAGINAYATEAWTTAASGSRLAFITTGNGTVARAERMTVDNAGLIGIGIASPIARLHVKNPSGSSAFPATTGTTQSVGHFARFEDGSNLSLDMGGFGANGSWLQSTDRTNLGTTYPLLLNPNGGNVGIGTTLPGSRLQVAGDAASYAGQLWVSGKTNQNQQLQLGYNTTTNQGFIQPTVSGSSYNDLVINPLGGNVGIATSPAYKLDVLGQTVNVTNTGGAALYRASNGTSDLRLQNNNGDGFVGMVTNNNFQIYANNAPRITALANGFVGVGTVTPATKLHVAADATTYAGQFQVSGITNPNQQIQVGYNTTTDQGFIQPLVSGSGYKDLVLQPSGASVVIGTSAGVISSGPARLTVYGAATNNAALATGAGTTIDFAYSNLAYTTASPTAFVLSNLKDGGTYTLAVKGTTSGTASFTASGFTVHPPVDNGASTAGKQSVYTLLVIGADVYMSWITGY